jgi:predicted TIM-barrel fold metal-dependent hydrolase
MSGVQHLSSSPSAAASSVNVQRAESAFHELSRQLSQGTFVNDKEHGPAGNPPKDIEKGPSDSEQPFDLREYLTSSNDANERVGIKHKHVGVTWEDFHVDVVGGSNFKVSWNASSNRLHC